MSAANVSLKAPPLLFLSNFYLQTSLQNSGIKVASVMNMAEVTVEEIKVGLLWGRL